MARPQDIKNAIQALAKLSCNTALDAGGLTKKPRSDTALPGFVLLVSPRDRPLMSPGLVVYLYLYTAPGLNDRRFGRRTIIVTHVDIGRQDHSDSSWRSAGGGTSQIRSIFGTARDRISTDPDAAVLFERRLGRNCVGVSLRRVVANCHSSRRAMCHERAIVPI